MNTDTSSAVLSERPSFRDLFTPKLITILSEGYDFGALRADVLAGLTVAIVALPLSMAIAIASGATPDRGLYTAIVGGFLVSALGGSRFRLADLQAHSSCWSPQPLPSTASMVSSSQH